MKLIPKDATSTGEKAMYAGVYIFVTGLILFMQLSAFGVFNNFYSIACKAAGWGWKIPGLICTALFVYLLYVAIKDEVENPPKPLMIFGALALALLCYCGFAYPYYL